MTADELIENKVTPDELVESYKKHPKHKKPEPTFSEKVIKQIESGNLKSLMEKGGKKAWALAVMTGNLSAAKNEHHANLIKNPLNINVFDYEQAASNASQETVELMLSEMIKEEKITSDQADKFRKMHPTAAFRELRKINIYLSQMQILKRKQEELKRQQDNE